MGRHTKTPPGSTFPMPLPVEFIHFAPQLGRYAKKTEGSRQKTLIVCIPEDIFLISGNILKSVLTNPPEGDRSGGGAELGSMREKQWIRIAESVKNRCAQSRKK